MSTELSRYERMRFAISECKMVDEVKEIRDQAMALRIYAQQAQDRTLEGDVIEIRLRAERRLGEMMRGQPKARGAEGNPGGRGAPIVRVAPEPAHPITLAETGIDKNLAHRARKLASMSPEKFEEMVIRAKHYRTTTVEERHDLPSTERIDDLIYSLTAAIIKGKPEDRLLKLRDACLKLASRIDQTLNERKDNVTCLATKRTETGF